MRQFTTENTTHEQAVAALNAVARWINESHAYLSERTPYASGYKDGVGQSKGIAETLILSETELRVVSDGQPEED